MSAVGIAVPSQWEGRRQPADLGEDLVQDGKICGLPCAFPLLLFVWSQAKPPGRVWMRGGRGAVKLSGWVAAASSPCTLSWGWLPLA